MIEVVPHPEWQRAWQVRLDGRPFLDCSPGGTGPCWNVRESDDEEGDLLHICDLDEMIEALAALRDSEAHQQNVDRWA